MPYIHHLKEGGFTAQIHKKLPKLCQTISDNDGYIQGTKGNIYFLDILYGINFRIEELEQAAGNTVFYVKNGEMKVRYEKDYIKKICKHNDKKNKK